MLFESQNSPQVCIETSGRSGSNQKMQTATGLPARSEPTRRQPKNASNTLCAVAAMVSLLFAGCDKKDSARNEKDAPITGKPSDAPVQITPAWKAGQRYHLRLERLQLSELGAVAAQRGLGTNSAPMEVLYAQEYAINVTNADSGHRGLELEITGLELQISRGEEQFLTYDSQNKVAPRDGNNPLPGLLDRLIGGKIHYLLDTNGHVVKLEGTEELFKRIETQGADARATGAAGMLRQALTGEVFKQMVELSGAPPEAVRIGEAWPTRKQVQAPMVGALTILVTNTLRGWQTHDGAPCARVEFSGTLGTGDASESTTAPRRLRISDGVVTGYYCYDPVIGLPREVATEQRYTIAFAGFGGRTRGGDTNGANREVRAPIKESTNVKLLEVKKDA